MNDLWTIGAMFCFGIVIAEEDPKGYWDFAKKALYCIAGWPAILGFVAYRYATGEK